MRKGRVISARDSKGNNLAIDQVVKIVNGPFKGLTGPIRHYDRNYLFLWNKEFVQSNGIFVEYRRSDSNKLNVPTAFVSKSSNGIDAARSWLG